MRWKLSRILAAVAGGAVLVIASAAAGASAPAGPADSTAPAPSTWAGTLSVAAKNQYSSASDGDLWPSCWASDGSVHAAWGDGHGFDPDSPFVDVGTARIDGDAPSLTGTNTATADGVSQVWYPGTHTRKPTGMVCVGNTLYLAVQDLSTNFSEVPAATIVKSTDGGKTWTWDKRKPMFDDHLFTTIWFADYGRGGEWNTSRYLYAYGLDGNWRDSPPPFNDVPDPQDMFLARVPKTRVQDRGAWQFFSGYAKNGTPSWTGKIADKKAVLHDARRDYPRTFSDDSDGIGSSVLGQGGVTYDKPLNRYISVGWSEWVMHFYESPTPWGPWTSLGDKDFTTFDDRTVQYSGYGTSFPSKFLSADGKTLMLQSNRCCGGSTGYQFSLRPVTLQLHQDGDTHPAPGPENLATDPTTVAISTSVRQGSLDALSNGDSADSVDDRDGGVKSTDWWGYTWPAAKSFNEVTFTTGTPQADGGWFITRPAVQYRVNGAWSNVPIQGYEQKFTPGSAAGDHATYTVRFPKVTGDGVRILGIPGGDHTYSSMSEIAVHFRNASLVDGGFENTTGYGGAWNVDGTAPHGIDAGCCARTGTHNAWIRTQSALGKQYVYQSIDVVPGTTLDLSAWVRSSAVVNSVYIGARWSGGSGIATVPALDGDYQNYRHTVTVPAGVTSIDVMVGYSADGGDAIFQVDDVAVSAP